MRVIVEWVAPEGLEKGKRTNEFNIKEGATISELIRRMVEVYGEAAAERILYDDGGTPYVMFIVNGKLVSLDYVLKSTDEILILPPIYGG